MFHTLDRENALQCVYGAIRHNASDEIDIVHFDAESRKCLYMKATTLVLVSPALRQEDGVKEGWIRADSKLCKCCSF